MQSWDKLIKLTCKKLRKANLRKSELKAQQSYGNSLVKLSLTLMEAKLKAGGNSARC